MISSRYLYPIVLLVLAWSWSLYLVYQYATYEEPDYSTFQWQASVSKEATDDLKLRQRNLISEFERKLADDARSEFRCLLPPLRHTIALEEQVAELFREMRKDLSRHEFDRQIAEQGFEQIRLKISTRLGEMQDTINSPISRYYDLLDMRPEDLDDFRMRLDKIIEGRMHRTTKVSSTPEALLLLQQYELKFTLSCYELQQTLMQQLGRKISCFFGPRHWPFLYDNDRIIRQYTEGILHFGIGTFSSGFASKHVRLVIGKDTIQPNMAGDFEVPVPTRKAGKQEDEITLLITNPLTGEVKTVSSQFSYYVY